MKQLKMFFPTLCGLIVVVFSYFMEWQFEQNVLSDSKFTENIYQLLKHQQVDDEASGLITEAMNSMVANNHALLLESLDFIWAIGLAIILWSFPYKVIFRTDE
ncbi:MAG: hypothetical protein ACJAXW_003827 [Candidatus Azotimanducaceae bacterium]|jgi:hypothetical protein